MPKPDRAGMQGMGDCMISGPIYDRDRIVVALTRANVPETIQGIILHHHDRAVKLAEQRGYDRATGFAIDYAGADPGAGEG